ncbi:MAG: CheR family methyltransferase [Pseudomonadota bacterium]|nr:CheR family methyltransferase [Pseudomonadota bacterium]
MSMQESALASALEDCVKQTGELVAATLDQGDWQGREWQALICRLAVGETRFLRDRQWFSALSSAVLAPLVAERASSGQREVSVWVAGCSTGEEAYSLGMQLLDLVDDPGRWQLRLDATDINLSALEHARAGMFREQALRELCPAERERWLTRHPSGRWCVHSELRRLVSFEAVNLCVGSNRPDSAARRYDLVVCRNVLIHIARSRQPVVAGRLADAVADRGWLAVTAAEAQSRLFPAFERFRQDSSIFLRRAVPKCQTSAPRPVKIREAAATAHLATGSPAPSTQIAQRASPPEARSTVDTAMESVARARVHAGCGRYIEALALCAEALGRDPLDLGALLLRATLEIQVGDIAAAGRAASGAVYVDPRSAAAHYMLGLVRQRQGFDRAARQSMARALRALGELADNDPVPDLAHLTCGAMRRDARSTLHTGISGGPL